jgi:hypothetical protein
MATQPYTAVALRIVAEWLVEKLIKSIDSVGQFDTIAHFDLIPEILDPITGVEINGANTTMTKCILISAYLCHHAFNFHKIPVHTATRVGITLLDHEIPRSLTSSDGTLGENTDLWRKKLANDVQPDHTICCMGLQSPVMILKKLRLVDSDVFTLFKCIESSTFAPEDAELPTGARKCAVFVLGSFHWTGYSINLTNGIGYHFDCIDGSSLDQGRTPTFIEESKEHAIKRTTMVPCPPTPS